MIRLSNWQVCRSFVCSSSPYLHIKNHWTALSIGNGKFQIVAWLAIGISLMAVITEGAAMSYVLPAAKCELKMSTAVQGFTNSVGYLGVIFASHFWGFMADTWGRRKVLRTALLISFVLSLISSLSLNSWMLIITRFASSLRCMQYLFT